MCTGKSLHLEFALVHHIVLCKSNRRWSCQTSYWSSSHTLPLLHPPIWEDRTWGHMAACQPHTCCCALPLTMHAINISHLDSWNNFPGLAMSSTLYCTIKGSLPHSHLRPWSDSGTFCSIAHASSLGLVCCMSTHRCGHPVFGPFCMSSCTCNRTCRLGSGRHRPSFGIHSQLSPLALGRQDVRGLRDMWACTGTNCDRSNPCRKHNQPCLLQSNCTRTKICQNQASCILFGLSLPRRLHAQHATGHMAACQPHTCC